MKLSEEHRNLLENCNEYHREAINYALIDLYSERKESLIKLPIYIENLVKEKLLKDSNNYLIFLVYLQSTLWIIFSSFIQIYFLSNLNYFYKFTWLFVHLFVNWVILGERFILAMHYATHNEIFCDKKLFISNILNGFPRYILSNFWGIPAGTYYLHHIMMHHKENNCFPYDITSTMPYNRSNIIHLFHYIINFLLHTFIYLPFYAIIKKKYKLTIISVLTNFSYFGIYYILSNKYKEFFYISFGTSFIIGPIALMVGNYAQHLCMGSWK